LPGLGCSIPSLGNALPGLGCSIASLVRPETNLVIDSPSASGRVSGVDGALPRFTFEALSKERALENAGDEIATVANVHLFGPSSL
jgi:hypothetical protein